MRSLADRWRGPCGGTERAVRHGRKTAPAALSLSLQGFRVAVMIQVVSGAYEHIECSRSSSDARLSGKPRESLSGDPHAVPPQCPANWGMSQAENGSMIETAIGLRSGETGGLDNRASVISKQTNAPVLGEPLPLHALQAASLCSGPVCTPRRAPPKIGAAVHDSFL
jgi:hypothetical protein